MALRIDGVEQEVPAVNAEPAKIGMIINADAGARPNPGFCGWGLHGYKFIYEEMKKGTGLSDQVLTDKGYIHKAEYLEVMAQHAALCAREESNAEPPYRVVKPIAYIDGHGSFPFETTNNVGELTAATNAILFALDHPDIQMLHLITDSEYVVRGTNEYLDRWKQNGWLRQDGNPIANKEFWITYSNAVEKIRAAGITLTIEWVKGHSGFFGNEMADKYATLGVVKARGNVIVNDITVSDPEGYWKYKVDRHPFIANRRLYFNTLPDYQVPGQYYLGEHGKDDDMLGKKSSDGAFAFVALTTPDPVLELLREYQSEIADGVDSFIMARLDYIYNPDIHRDITQHSRFAFDQPNQHRLDLFGLDNKPATRELRPAKLAIRAIEALSELSQRLDEFISGSDKYTATDLTDLFYDKKEVVKKGKEPVITFSLKSNIIVGLASLDVIGRYKQDDAEKELPVTLTFGIDLPARNAIKQMESLQPKIQLITWKESDKAIRYATVITAEGAVGIWAGVYSNLQVVKD